MTGADTKPEAQRRWKTIPVFISSTFLDMQIERDILNNDVFLRLEERLSKRRCRLEPIDLRIGVESRTNESEQEREERILKVCLNEIDRSRPFLLVLLGDRYGWVPQEERIQTAAAQAGFKTETAGQSVTSLEIEYGLLLKDPAQRQRSLVMLREPLPYAEMGDKAAIFSDEYATDAGAALRASHLKVLKQRLTNDPLLQPHLHSYSMGWDQAMQCPTDDHAWNDKVFEAFWTQLDEETLAFAQKPDPAWQEQERFALEEFTERLDRSFAGRKALVDEAVKFALSPMAEDAAQAWCVTGISGAGKSAFFSRVYRRLLSEKGPVLLAEAGGISPRAGRLHWTLHRWIGELAAAIGVKVELPDNLRGQELEARFAEMLDYAASKRRIILMADALNQFERTDRMISLRWLPNPLPANVRLLATAIPGPESEKLGYRNGARITALPVFNPREIHAVAKAVYARYHRKPEKEVVEHLKSVLHEGQPAAGNALWLTLALELLNLLDADDFAEAETYRTEHPGERLRRLVLNRCKELPATIEGLYVNFLGRVEKATGMVEARVYASLLALSRHGWREEDLKSMLIPAAAVLFPDEPQPEWDALRFAIFRRFFRAHLIARGESLQWDFTHASLRTAIYEQLRNAWKPPSGNAKPALHSVIAGYLEKSSSGAPMREEELMWQMLGTQDLLRFARYYISPETASGKLAEYLIEENLHSNQPLLKFVLALISDARISPALQAGIGNKFNFDLYLALDEQNGWALQQPVLEAVEALFSSLYSRNPKSVEYARELSICYERLGDIQNNLGQGKLAQEFYARALQLREELHGNNPKDAACARDLAILYNRMADLLRGSGVREQASTLYHKALSISESLHQGDPRSVIFNRDLSVSYERLGDLQLSMGHGELALDFYGKDLRIANELYQITSQSAGCARDLATSYERMGDLQIELGMIEEATEYHRQALNMREKLYLNNPQSVTAAQEVLVSYERLSELTQRQGYSAQALEFSQKGLGIAEELLRHNPQSAIYSHDLVVGYGRMGDLHLAQEQTEKARGYYERALGIAKELHQRNPQSADFIRNLAATYDRIGDLFLALGQGKRALEFYTIALNYRKDLRQRDSESADFTYDLSVSYERIGDIHLRHSQIDQAMGSYSDVLKLREELLHRNPDSAVFARAVFVICERLGALQADLGNNKEALAYYQRQLEIAKDLHRRSPQLADYQRDLSVSYERIGDMHSRLGQFDLALGSYSEAHAFRQRLYNRDPQSVVCANDLAVIYERMGDINNNLGRREMALELYNKALLLRDDLLRLNSQSEDFLRALSAILERIGDLHRDLGHTEEAIQYYQRCLSCAEKLANRDPESADSLRQLSDEYQRMGDCQKNMGQLEAALNTYGKDLAIALDLCQRNPGSAELSRNLSVSYGRVADLYVSLNQREKAFEYYSQALSISRNLRLRDSQSQEFARHLAVDCERMGDYYRGSEQWEQAEKFYRETLVLREELMQLNRQSADAARDLFVSYWRMADLAERTGAGDAIGWWRKALDLLVDMRQRGILMPADLQFLEIVRQKLSQAPTTDERGG